MALVVTIVVLLILAGITITYVFGDNGVFKLAQKAKDETENAIENEKTYMNDIGNIIDEYMNGVGNLTPTVKDETISGTVDKIQNENTIVHDENGNELTIPGGFKVVPDTEDNDVDYTYSGDKTPCVQDGVVIEDEDGNQFVWIPIGKIKNKDNTSTVITLGRYEFDTTNGTPKLRQTAFTDMIEDTYTHIASISSELGKVYQELTNPRRRQILLL